MEKGESSNQPQKSTTRATTSGIVIREGGAPASNAATGNAAGNPNPPRRVTNQYAPTANVTRIMRRGLSANAKIAEEAKETMQDCVTEFISFITDEANERCQREHRKMITADDLLAAMAALGFDNYVGPLALFLNKYRAAQEPERGSGSTSQLAPRVADVAPPSPPPPAPPVAAAAEEAVGSDEFVGLTEFLDEYIFGRRDQQGGGEGSSSGV